MQDRIYSIQMDESYLFAEGMEENEQASFDLVLSALLEKANDVRRQAHLPPLGLNQLRGLTQKLSASMGGCCYVFGFAKRTDVKAAKASGGGTEGRKPAIAINLPSHNKANEPASQPVESSSRPEPRPIQSVQPTQPVQPIQPTQPEEQPTPQSSQSAQQTAVALAPANAGSHYASVAAELLQLGDAYELLRYIKSYIEGGQLRDYGNIMALSDIPTDAYVVLIYAEDLTISAILSPSGTNMATGQADDIHNYKGHQVLWYR